jgi:hypothetical protein
MSINSIGSNMPIEVAKGGTGVATFTSSYAVICGGTTATNPLQNIASIGTATQVLTSNGAGLLPTFQDNPNVPNYTPTTAFVKTISFGGNSVGVTMLPTSKAYYTIVGSLVYFFVSILLTSKGSSTGKLQIRGMPAVSTAAMTTLRQQATGSLIFLPSVPSITLTGYIEQDISNPALTALSIYYPNVSLGLPTAYTNTNIANNSRLLIAGCYTDI